MTGTVAIVLIGAGVAAMIGTEIIRSVVHRRREQRDGLGGTQDIALWGTVIGFSCFVGAGICGLLWSSQR